MANFLIWYRWIEFCLNIRGWKNDHRKRLFTIKWEEQNYILHLYYERLFITEETHFQKENINILGKMEDINMLIDQFSQNPDKMDPNELDEFVTKWNEIENKEYSGKTSQNFKKWLIDMHWVTINKLLIEEDSKLLLNLSKSLEFLIIA
uniref:Uncharacterized protein n=1 Tax=Meloidogyne enterolobii TaxID=390850 RepID=A0A6V7W8T1_MELEN|nr:unnamed protein product [Meloidogyne enterolobii]